MGKNVGKPYSPELRQSEHGSRLYNAWKKLRRKPYSEEWNDFQSFYNWSIRDGYSIGDTLVLIDDSKPYSPENCVWRSKANADPQREQEWNAAVNRIRKYYGMPPLEGTDYGS